LIDPVITGIHCLTTADINNDGKEDLIINNFEPSRGLSDSMAWFSAPSNPLSASHWDRHVFAAGDARGGSHYMGAGDVDGDGWMEIAVGAKGKPFANGNWFAFWKNPGEKKQRLQKISQAQPTFSQQMSMGMGKPIGWHQEDMELA
jgi:hypothetical protein